MRHVTPLTCPAWSSKGCVCPEQDAFINERRSGTDRRAQLAEVAPKDAKDLARYRWLRDVSVHDGYPLPDKFWDLLGDELGEDFDERIDAAMPAPSGPEQPK